MVETKEGGEQVYRQQVYLRQYQPPTPEPVDIQVQEVVIKPQVVRPPIHVYVGANQNRAAQRTPSPILIRSAPPQPPPPSEEPRVFNKYIPVDYKQPPQQVCRCLILCTSVQFSPIRSSFIVILNYHQNHVSHNTHRYSLLNFRFFFLFDMKRSYCCRTMASE